MHHRRGLRRLLKDDALLERIETLGYENAGLDERRLEMVRWVDKLTRTPAKMTEQDLAPLRRAGFVDADILAIAEVTGYYAYVNRIADGLGVQLESDVEEP